MSSRRRSRRFRRARRSLAAAPGLVGDVLGDVFSSRRRVVLAAVAAVLLVLGVVFVLQATRAVGALEEVNQRAERLRATIVDGDVDAARDALKQFDEASTRARENTDGPLWWTASKVPILGRNLEALRVTSRELDQVSDEVLPGIVDVADKVKAETFRPRKGRVDLDAVKEATPMLARADEVFTDASRDVDAVDAEGLIGPLETPMLALQAIFDATARAASAAHDAADLLPGMLGDDGKERTYLLLIMNNAEVRSLVGMPGSYAVITAKDGKVEMGRQGSGQDVGVLSKPKVDLSDEEKIVFQSSIATDPRDTAIHPDFPRAAQLAASIVETKWKDRYDGVIGVDPVTLSYVLAGIGPVEAGKGNTLNGRNAVGTLLNGVYLKYPKSPSKQDDVFKLAARRIFDAVVEGRGRSQRVLRALVQGVSERRLMLWSRDDDVQARLRDSGIANTLEGDPDRPQVGVYVNDGGSTKMQFYLGMSTKVRSEQCLDGDRQELRTTTTLVSNTPSYIRRLPFSVTGFTKYVIPGNQLLNVMVMGPEDGRISSMTVDGQPAPVGGASLDGRPVTRVARELAPGQSSVIITTMLTGEDSPGDAQLRTTPGILPNDDSVAPSACAD